jgi:hypothetical protein
MCFRRAGENIAGLSMLCLLTVQGQVVMAVLVLAPISTTAILLFAAETGSF